MGQRRNDVTAVAPEERSTFLPDGAQISLYPFLLPRSHVTDKRFEQVDVQTTAQASIRRHHHIAHALYFTLDHERVLVLDVRLGNVPNNLTHLFRIRACRLHAFLSLTHLARRDHFHGAGDLLRALDAGYLVTYFFSDGHNSLPSQVRHSLL